ncbi:MAG: TetR/AcrR family transcriptional regulator [Acidobacteria bacterium]|nr:TetR/AcrR family transcriptional regulator [Acidobacteriota bacterium]
MRKIAEKIEYSPTTIYLYFKDKSDLLVQICEETFAGLAKKLEAIDAKYDDPFEGLKEGCRAYINFALKHPNHYKVVFIMMPQEEADAGQYEYVGSMGDKAFSYLRENVANCIKQNKKSRVDVVDVDVASQVIWAALHGLTSLLITHKDFPWASREKLIGQMIDMIIRTVQE